MRKTKTAFFLCAVLLAGLNSAAHAQPGYDNLGGGGEGAYQEGPPQAYGNRGGYGGGMPAASQATPAANPARVRQWFTQYDQIRRQAQMSPAERQRSDYLLSRGMAILMPGEEKIAAREILIKLVNKYQVAKGAMQALPPIPETLNLHRGYYQYFNNAHQLFSDYLRVQDNLFVTDASTGKPVAGQLLQRKAMLEQLRQQIQGLDEQTRNQFGVPPYKY